MEPGNTEHYLEQLNLTELMEQLNRCFSSAFLADFSLEQIFSDILSGNGKEALQLLGRQITGSVGQEFSGMRQILSVLLLLGILSVLVSCLMGSFENQQVAQIAHDMFFLLVLTVLLKVFSAVYRITGSTLETLKQFSHLTLPALCLSLGPAAGSVTAADLPLEQIGPHFEHHERFPRRTNTEFVEIVSPEYVKMRVWERGTGETLACGTGCCATAVACVLNGKTGRKVTVEVLGGALTIQWDEKTNHIFMTGPAEFVFDGELEYEV